MICCAQWRDMLMRGSARVPRQIPARSYSVMHYFTPDQMPLSAPWRAPSVSSIAGMLRPVTDLAQPLLRPYWHGQRYIMAPAVPPAAAQVARAAAKPPNSLQKSLAAAAFHLPTAGADTTTHIQRPRSARDVAPQHAAVAAAARDAAAHVKGFLGRS